MHPHRYHTTLTNYARGLAQDMSSAVASFLAPEVVVNAAVGQFKSFNDKNNFQAPDTARAVGGPAKRLHFEADDPHYNCRPNALEITIDDHERDEGGKGDPLHLEEAKTLTLVSSATISHERKVVTYANGATTAESGMGAWSGPTNDNDPIAEVDDLILKISTQIGQMPNRLLIGLPAWAVIRHNPQLIARFPGAAKVGVSLKEFASLLLNPDIDIKVATLSYDQNKWGQAANKANIVGSELYVFFASQKPTQYDASFMKTFRTRRGGVDKVRLYREESCRSDILAVDWTEDTQVTSTICGKRITIS